MYYLTTVGEIANSQRPGAELWNSKNFQVLQETRSADLVCDKANRAKQISQNK